MIAAKNFELVRHKEEVEDSKQKDTSVFSKGWWWWSWSWLKIVFVEARRIKAAHWHLIQLLLC